jgi:hypothetical protein
VGDIVSESTGDFISVRLGDFVGIRSEYRDITSEGLLRASSFKGLSKGTRRS